MRKFIALCLGAVLALAPLQAFAGVAIINGGGTNGLLASGTCNLSSSCPTTTSVVSGATTVDVPVGSFVVAASAVRDISSGCASVTDSAGNTYATGANQATSGNQSGSLIYTVTTIDLPIGSTFTCTTAGGSTASRGIMVAAFSGTAATPHDAASASPVSGSGTVQSIGPTGTLACPGGGANCELLIAAWTNHSLGAQSAQTAGFIQFGCITANFSNECMAYEIVSATTAQSYTSTNASSDIWAMFLDGFKAATSGAAVGCRRRSLLGVGC